MGHLIWILMVIGIWIAGIIGYILNIVKLTDCDFSNIGAEIVLRIIGIFTVIIGVILGYVGHF